MEHVLPDPASCHVPHSVGTLMALWVKTAGMCYLHLDVCALVRVIVAVTVAKGISKETGQHTNLM